MNKVALEAVLDFINTVRKEQGRGPLEEIPKGALGDPRSCPIASGINHEFSAYVGCEHYSYTNPDGKRKRRKLPQIAKDFVYSFDHRRIPKLIDRKKTKIFQLKGEIKQIKEAIAYKQRMVRKYRDPYAEHRVEVLKRDLEKVQTQIKELER